MWMPPDHPLKHRCRPSTPLDGNSTPWWPRPPSRTMRSATLQKRSAANVPVPETTGDAVMGQSQLWSTIWHPWFGLVRGCLMNVRSDCDLGSLEARSTLQALSPVLRAIPEKFFQCGKERSHATTQSFSGKTLHSTEMIIVIHFNS